MNKTFYTNSNRPITINIVADFINFHFKAEANRLFYSIPIDDWMSDGAERLDREDNWHHHMKEKIGLLKK